MIYNDNNHRKVWKKIIAIILILALGGGIIFLSSESKVYSYLKEKNYVEESDSNKSGAGGDITEEYGLPMVVIELPEGKTMEDLNQIKDLTNLNPLGEKESLNNSGSIESKYPRVRLESDLTIYTPQGDTYVQHIKEKILFGLRGQSSLYYPKKQFAINFIDENGEDKKVSPLGMAEDNSFVLNGSYVDNSSMRNYLAYRISDEIMEYSPDVQFCEVYVLDSNNRQIGKDTYHGVYLFMEKNTRGENRIDIKKNDQRYNDVSFIIARDKSKIGDIKADTLWSKVQRSVIVKAGGIVVERSGLVVNYPDSETITENELKAIEDYINNFEYALYSSDFKDKNKGYRRYIDVDSFIDYAIINEVFQNTDGGDVSTYFYKDIGGKLTAGPVWDFDLILGNTITSEVPTYDGFRMYNTIWYDQLFKDPYFVKRYIARYKYLRKSILNMNYINNVIDQGVKELGEALERNRDRWYTTESGYERDVNPHEEIENMKNYLELRLKWIDDNLSILLRKDYE